MDYIWKEFTNRTTFIIGVVYSVIVGLLAANIASTPFLYSFFWCLLGWYIGQGLVIAARIIYATYMKDKENNG